MKIHPSSQLANRRAVAARCGTDADAIPCGVELNLRGAVADVCVTAYTDHASTAPRQTPIHQSEPGCQKRPRRRGPMSGRAFCEAVQVAGHHAYASPESPFRDWLTYPVDWQIRGRSREVTLTPDFAPFNSSRPWFSDQPQNGCRLRHIPPQAPPLSIDQAMSCVRRISPSPRRPTAIPVRR